MQDLEDNELLEKNANTVADDYALFIRQKVQLITKADHFEYRATKHTCKSASLYFQPISTKKKVL